ncbi:MAG: hypothetical protein K0U86_13915 [Planctomycetes bacterium]|nr:hypothetical protein [Planctomycetota bacterium]MCH9725990.1 hypothetical protein [Planctomycetota bacterium]MCH9777143.1 hypothetical protein [Planctomycetota bacterium]MCH9790876.1 hypothetical protein [Planctomycetota bacterium]
MSGMLRQKYVVALLGCLAAGWLVMAVNAEEKQSKKKQKQSPSVSQAVVPKVKPVAKQSVKEPKPIFYPELTKRELKIQEALNSDSECDFSDAPLSEVIKSLADRHGVTMLLLEDPLGDEGLTVDEPVSLSVKGIALKNVLDLILNPIGLTYVVDREVVKITTIVKAEEVYKTRVYPVGDFGNTPEVYLELGAMITNSSLEYWEDYIQYDPLQGVQGSGAGSNFFQVISEMNPSEGNSRPRDKKERDGGTISIVRSSQCFVITHSYHAHNEVVELLTNLRRIRALD